MQASIASRCSKIINHAVSYRVNCVAHAILNQAELSTLKLNAFLSDFSARPPQKSKSSFGNSGDQGLAPNGNALFSTSAAPAPEQEKKPVLMKTGAPGENADQTKIIATLAKYLWMKDNYELRLRVVATLGLLIGTKVINVQVLFLFKLAIDWLATSTSNPAALAEFSAANSTALVVFATPAAVLVGYGIARLGAAAFNELRTDIFFKVALRTIRQVSDRSFHICMILTYYITLVSATGEESPARPFSFCVALSIATVLSGGRVESPVFCGKSSLMTIWKFLEIH